ETQRQQLVDSHQRLTDSNARHRRALEQATELSLGRGLELCEQGQVRQGLLWLARSLEIAPADADALAQRIRANLAAWARVLAPLKATIKHPEVGKADIVLSPDGKTAVTLGWSGALSKAQLWQTDTGQPIGEPLPFFRSWWADAPAVFSPDGKQVLVVDSATTVQLWDTATAKPAAAPLQHGDNVRVAVFRPDGKRLLTGCEDKTARLWEVTSGKPL